MIYLIVQTVLLIAIAFILGAILGCLLRRWFAGDTATADRPAAATAVPAAAVTPSAGQAPHVPSAPVPEAEPQVVPQPLAAPIPPEPEVVDVPEEVPQETAAAVVPATGGTEAEGEAAPAPPAKKTKRASVRKAAPRAASVTVPASGEPDNLKLIRGIGPQNEARLNAIGIDRFAQVAAWTKREQREIGERLSFPGRIEREEWVKQAKQLAKGKQTEFSTRAGSGRVRTSSGIAASAEPGSPPARLDAARGGKPDNLTLIDGVGNAIERKLFKLGIFHFDQMALWTREEGVWVGNEIGFPGRVERENWVAEAKVFAEGGTTEHAARVERGQIRTSRKSTDGES